MRYAEDFVFWDNGLPEGVRLPLETLQSQLVFTFFLTAAELLFVSSAFVVHKLVECQLLSNGRALRVKSHSQRVRAIQFLALVMFLSLETLVSVFTKEYHRSNRSQQECVTVSNGSTFSFDEMTVSKHEAVQLPCFQFNKNNAKISGGHYGLNSNQVECRNEIFSFEFNNLMNETVATTGVWSCTNRDCVYMFSQGLAVFASTLLDPDSRHSATEVVGFWTNLTHDRSAELDRMVTGLFNMYQKGIFDELQLRKGLFTEASRGKCKMITSTSPGTVLPVWIVILSVSLWVLSIALFTATRFVKKNVFFDLQNPSEWALKTACSVPNCPDEGKAFMKFCYVDGVRKVFVACRCKNVDSDESSSDSQIEEQC